MIDRPVRLCLDMLEPLIQHLHDFRFYAICFVKEPHLQLVLFVDLRSHICCGSNPVNGKLLLKIHALLANQALHMHQFTNQLLFLEAQE